MSPWVKNLAKERAKNGVNVYVWMWIWMKNENTRGENEAVI